MTRKQVNRVWWNDAGTNAHILLVEVVGDGQLKLLSEQRYVARTILLQLLERLALLRLRQFRDLVPLRPISLLFRFHLVLEMPPRVLLHGLEKHTNGGQLADTIDRPLNGSLSIVRISDPGHNPDSGS